MVNIYQAVQRRQHFGRIQNAFIRIVDARNNQELCRYNLSENYDNMTAMIFGEVYRNNGEWKFNAIGQATTDPGLVERARRYMCAPAPGEGHLKSEPREGPASGRPPSRSEWV